MGTADVPWLRGCEGDKETTVEVSNNRMDSMEKNWTKVYLVFSLMFWYFLLISDITPKAVIYLSF